MGKQPLVASYSTVTDLKTRNTSTLHASSAVSQSEHMRTGHIRATYAGS